MVEVTVLEGDERVRDEPLTRAVVTASCLELEQGLNPRQSRNERSAVFLKCEAPIDSGITIT